MVAAALVVLPLVAPAGAPTAGPPTSGNPVQRPAWRLELESELRERGVDPSTIVFPERLSAEMLDWLHAAVPRRGGDEEKLDRLLEALVADDGLGLVYEDGHTGTAEEVFDNRRANCLAFTHLFVGLTRELGLDTYYLGFNRIQEYRREGDLVLISGHVTAGYGTGRQRRILEFGIIPEADYRQASRLSDVEALGLYYSNRGAELLRAERYDEARRWSETAVELVPDLADAWVNLGVVRRRSGDTAGAEAAYRRAVEADADHLPAYQNLSALMWLRGEHDVAQQILKLLDRRDNRNPVTYVSLGAASLQAERLEEARAYYRRALKLGRLLPEPRAALGMWARASGQPRRARGWLERAAAIEAASPRVRALALRLAAAE